MRPAASLGLILTLVIATGFAVRVRADDDQARPRCQDFRSIGTATMDAQGVITMDLRTLPPDPPGMGRIVYRPDDTRYESALRHLGPIRPGETVNVPPWC